MTVTQLFAEDPILPTKTLASKSAGKQTSPVNFQKVRSRRLFEEVCEQVQAQIASGALKVGDRLPSERDLAVQFGISRSAVREALRSLEIAGLISLQKGVTGGSFVTSSEDGLVRSFQTMFAVGHLLIEDLAEAREGILELVVRLAAQRATPSDFKRMEQDIARTAKHLETEIFLPDPSLTQEFYVILAEATRNQVIVMLVKGMSHLVYKTVRPLHIPIYFDIISFRKKLVAHLKKKNGEAAALALRDYLAILNEHISAAKEEKK
jgi:GntR family transcriptional repressor for pyruvate dehydrogenase complex